MTLSTETTVSGPYLGNGVTTTFGYGFKVNSAEQVEVVLLATDGATTVLSSDSFSVTGVGSEEGGSILLSTPPVTGAKVWVRRSLLLTQETDLKNQSAYLPESVEKRFDTTVMQIQQINEGLGRALKVNLGDTPPDISRLVGDINDAMAASAAAVGAANGQYTFDTMAAAAAAEIPSVIHGVYLRGKANRRDGLGGLWVDDNNGSQDTFISADGRTWYRVAYVSTAKSVLRDSLIDTPLLTQKFELAPFYGFIDPANVSSERYPGARFVTQGIDLFRPPSDPTKVHAIITQRRSGGSWTVPETCRMAEWDMAGDGSAPVAETGDLQISHGADVSVVFENGKTYVYTSLTTVAGKEGSAAGRGWTKIEWKGAATTQADAQTFQVIDYAGNGDPLEAFNRGSVAADADWVVMVFPSPSGGRRPVVRWDRKTVEAMGSPIGAAPAKIFYLNTPTDQDLFTVQGVSIRNGIIAITYASTAVFGAHIHQFYDLNGTQLRDDIRSDDGRAQYTLATLLNHPTLGFPGRFELEGCSYFENRLYTVVNEAWTSTADVVMFEGQNWAYSWGDAIDSAGKAPRDHTTWVRTNKPPTENIVSAGSFVTNALYEIVTVGTTNFMAIGAPDNNVGTVFTASGPGTGTGTAAGSWTPGDTLAGSFIVGKLYVIASVGTTNFTAIGAANNSVGTLFTATGSGSGTGTATRAYTNSGSGNSKASRVAKRIYSFGVPVGDPLERTLDKGLAQLPSAAALHTGQFPYNITYMMGRDFTIAAWSQSMQSYRKAINFSASGQFQVFDPSDGADNTKYGGFFVSMSGGNEQVGMRVNGSIANGAGTNWIGNGDPGTNPGGIRDYTAGKTRRELTNTGKTTLSSDVGVSPLNLTEGTTTISLRVGSGSPSGVVTATPGSVYFDIAGGWSLKTSGTGNTGWTTK